MPSSFTRQVILLSMLWFTACASKPPPPSVTPDHKLQLDLAKLHFANGDYDLARKEYIRLLLNPASRDANLQELAHYMIGESYYLAGDCPQAERYFRHYLAVYASGYKRAESQVRLQQCAESLQAAATQWSTPQMRQATVVVPPPTTPPAVKISRGEIFRTTWYWIENQSDYPQRQLQPLLDRRNQVIAQVPQAFLQRLLVEGTGRLLDGSVVNWVAPQRFERVDDNAPYGWGAGQQPLIPFRTVAVDKSHVRLGSIIYIRALDGLVLANGLKHDGCMVAGDVGSAIKGRHLDLFAPSYQEALWLMRQLPEKVQVQSVADHCQTHYQVADGYQSAG